MASANPSRFSGPNEIHGSMSHEAASRQNFGVGFMIDCAGAVNGP